ncbi:MAG: ROK family protein [Lachnospirales bacterium]
MDVAAIEAGGTKFVLAIGNEKGEVFHRHVVKTTTPEETMTEVKTFFDKYEFQKMAVGSFGPIDIDVNSKTYGHIRNTPKKAWINFDLIGELKSYYDVDIALNTDVNCAALGEFKIGAAKNSKSCLYMTVGTGIGVGAVVNGRLLSGVSHPEMGHILIKRHEKDTYEGKCIYHKDCFEGLASGPAIMERAGVLAQNIPEGDIAWDIEAYYLAQGLVNFILTLAPEKIILGGGVSKQKHLFPLIHKYVKELLNGYLDLEVLNSIEDYIVYAHLGDDAGIKGTLILANE